MTTPPTPVRRATWMATLVSVVAFGLLLTDGSPTDLLDRGPFTSDFFDEQMHALLEGHMDVDPGVTLFEGFEHEGRTYLYYGMVPSLLRLPVLAFTDAYDGRLGGLSMLLALCVTCWSAGRLSWFGRVAVRGSDHPAGPWEPWVVGGFVLTVGLSSPVLFLASRVVVYHEAELWGVGSSLLAAVALLRWWHEPSSHTLALASLAAAIAFNSRGSVGAGAVIALGLGLLAGWKRLPDRRRFLAAGLALALPVLTYSAVNIARFDSPWAIPVDGQALNRVDRPRQEALAANDGSLFGPQFVPTTLWSYIRPDGIDGQRLFPWITYRESVHVFGDPVFDTIDRTTSLPVAAPLLVVLAVPGLVAAGRRRIDVWGTLAVGGAIATVFVLTISFIANRYLSDFLYGLIVLSALGTWVVAQWLAGRHRRLVLGGAGLLAAFGVAVNAAVAVQTRHLFMLPSDDDVAELVSFQYRHDPSSGPAPEVHVVEDMRGIGEWDRGAVMLLEGCETTYWSNGSGWYAVEYGPPARTAMSGRLPSAEATVASGDGWRLTAHRDGEEAVIGFERGGERRESRHGVGDGDDPVAITLDRDRHRFMEIVRVDGEIALVNHFVTVTGEVDLARGWSADPVPTPLCDRLLPRAGAAVS